MDVSAGPLTVSFAGLRLRSPIIAASAPPTESAKAIVACARAGVGAVVTKSIVNYNRGDWPDIPRRVHRDRRGLWIQGSFASETLTVAEGVAIARGARDATDIPIIASIGVLDPTDDSAIETALRLVEVGANMVHFDLFYLPQPRSSNEAIEALRSLFRRARNALPVPFGPKLNTDIPVYRFTTAFAPDEFDSLFVLDSIRVPPPLKPDGTAEIDAWRGGLECSLFGDWQKPVTLQYTRTLAEAGMPSICSGGGFRSAEDILEAIMLGATSTQVATQLIVQGYDWVRRTNDHLMKLLDEHQLGNIRDIMGLALATRDREAPEHVIPVRAVVDDNKCKPCGVCTKLVFCSFISEKPSGTPLIDNACYGCGLCEIYCPQDGAIRMVPMT